MAGENTPDSGRQETPDKADATPTDNPGQEPGGDQEGSGGDEVAKVRREAAKYRTRLREAEAERDKAVGHAITLRRAELRRAFAEHLADPDDVLGGVKDEDLTMFFTEDCALNGEAVKGKADAAIAAKPHWRKAQPVNFDGGARQTQPDRAPSFGEGVKRAAGSG